jgi:hypothetical protein
MLRSPFRRRRGVRSAATAVLCLAVGTAAGRAQSLSNVRLDVVALPATPPGINNCPLRFNAIGDAATPAAFDLQYDRDLWQITFVQGVAPDGTFPPPVVAAPSNSTFQSFQFVRNADSFTAVWAGGWSQGMPPGESFTVTVEGEAAPGANVYELKIKAEFPPTGVTTQTITEIEFPRLHVRSRHVTRNLPLDPDELLAIPLSQGLAVQDPVGNLVGEAPFLHHPGSCSMQWSAYYATDEANAPVLFLGSRDTAGVYKQMLFGPKSADGFLLGMRQHADGGAPAGSNYVSPYPVTLGVVRGDWFDAAQEYRNWILNLPAGSRPEWLTTATGAYLQPLGLRLPSGEPSKRALPPQLLDAELVLTIDTLTNPRDFSTWTDDVKDQKAFYGADHVPSVVYHCYQSNAPALHALMHGAGEWHLPLARFLANLPHDASDWAPYAGFDGYDRTVSSYLTTVVSGFSGSVANFERIGADGAPAELTPTLGRLCSAAGNVANGRFVGRFMRDVATAARQRGARGIYLDEYSHEGGLPCWSADHGHPPGAGSYMTAARRANVDEMVAEQRLVEPQFYASSESPNETLSDCLQLTFNHAGPDSTYTFCRSLPMYSAVYSDYQLTARILSLSNHPHGKFGNDLQRKLIGLAAYFGDIPSGGSQLATELDPAVDEDGTYWPDFAANMGDPEFAKAAFLLRSMVRTAKRPAVRPYFHTGRRLRDPDYGVDRVSPTLIPNTSGALSSVWNTFVNDSGDQPTVFVSAWGDPAHPQDFGLMAVNWTDYADSLPANVAGGAVQGGLKLVTLTLDPAQLGGAQTYGNYECRLVDQNGEVSLGVVPLLGPTFLPIYVPPLTTWFVYFVKQ